MTRFRTSLLLTFSYFSTIFFEIFFTYHISSSSPKTTLFQHIQSSFSLDKSYNVIFCGLIIFVLLMIGLLMIHDHGIFIIYFTLLKFIEFLPILIDLVNLLFIYQYKIQHSQNENSWNRFRLSFILIFIRLIFSLEFVRRKCDCRWKRQILVIVDLLLFILINISLLRDSNSNILRLGRKLILGLLILQLNNLFYNETFWFNIAQGNRLRAAASARSHKLTSYTMNILQAILCFRWILSAIILGLFSIFTLQSTIINEHESFYDGLKSHSSVFTVCIIILYLIRWDTLQNRKTLNQYGILRFCTGIDLWSKKETSMIIPEIPTEKIHQTCAACAEDKDSDQFNVRLSAECRHANRTVCDICLFRHVQQRIEITFTDDIPCPEWQCGVRFDYHIVRNILSLGGDSELIERYDRYVTHRQLEQMEEFIWCTNPLCHVGQLNEGGRLNTIVTCFNCHQKTCFKHKIQWHEGISCEEYDQGIDPNYESSRRWIIENSKKCPQCPYQIEKNDGCDHMTCIKCRHQFCWSCLADFQLIRQHGNHRHNDTCKHYSAYHRR